MKPIRKRVTACLLAIVLFLATTGSASAQSLAWGSSGEKVRQVQQKLKQWGYYTGTVDGVYGQATYDAVVKFQRKNGLTADGVIGSSTAAAIGITLTNSSNSSTSQPSRGQSTSEIQLLARLIHGEARGEPYIGKVAVAAVVLNRVRHASFPNTIAGVIYQSGAFDAVADGQINLAPDADSLRAARDAMNGWDPTGGCLYYYNPSTATATWIWSRKIQIVIGRHNFAI